MELEEYRASYYYPPANVKLQNLANSDPSLCRNVVYRHREVFNPQSRLHAYDYQLRDNHKYTSENERVCDSSPLDYGFSNYHHPNNTAYCHQTKSRNSTRSRSKSSDRRERRKLLLPDNPNLWAGNCPGNGLPNGIQNGNIPAPLYEYDDYDEHYEVSPPVPFTALPARVVQRSNLNHELWLQSRWASRDSYRSPPALSPSSPLDSGLSSQSVASSPSLEAEPIASKNASYGNVPAPHCESPYPLQVVQKNQCSCPLNCLLEPKLLSPQMKSDSGRSSPWTHFAVARSNGMSEVKYADPAYTVYPPVDESRGIDLRRYSMSGIYISPRENMYGYKIPSRSKKSKNHGLLKTNKNDSCGYEYIDEGLVRTLSPKSNPGCSRSCPIEVNNSERDIQTTDNSNNTTDDIPSGNCEENSKSTLCLTPLNSSSNPSSQTKSKSSFECPKKGSSNSEKAITELEELYNNLNLQDYDLLDRAERRDLPTQHQMSRNKPLSSLSRSKSDTFYEILGPNIYKRSQRAPPLRRSGVPDIVADDMALRKLQKCTYKAQQACDPIPSYMLYSSHFTPSIPSPSVVLTAKRPDIEYDDFSFRKYFHPNSGKQEDAQTPFGIPLHPNQAQSVFSDYMHVVPSCIPPPLCHPRGNPDLVRDDLAFRTLRKDKPERAMYDSYSLYYRKVR